MFEVTNTIGHTLQQCDTLDQAMTFAKGWAGFVIIRGPSFEVCGMFGVDTVKDGKCPDGFDYDWNKSGRIGSPKRNLWVDLSEEEGDL
jgi:hypothetical protein